MRYFTLIIFFLISTQVFGFSENITITTYYPAPFGVYKNLNVSKLIFKPLDEVPTEPTKGNMYYDNQEHALKYYSDQKWAGVVWFDNAGVSLKDGAEAKIDELLDKGRRFGSLQKIVRYSGFSKYEMGKIYTRAVLYAESGNCDSGWKDGTAAKCQSGSNYLKADTGVLGVYLSLKNKHTKGRYTNTKDKDWLLIGSASWH
ncbi:MAG: hypothetical protein KAS05_02600 [Candidatus Omnitrophica bacterium]|nr:hypothetical protein [Candidatus Omnitrophota bacterium]